LADNLAVSARAVAGADGELTAVRSERRKRMMARPSASETDALPRETVSPSANGFVDV
jgi:hypothetical protein